MGSRDFSNVSLLITHYNRSGSLRRLLTKMQSLECKFGEIIVSDDASRPEHLDKLEAFKDEFNFKLVTTPVNKGLGNNINKGQDAVTKPFTLYVQEDFVPKDVFPEHFSDALQLLDTHTEMDIARFYAYYPYAYRKPFEKGFELMDFKLWYPGYMKFYCYSDHPHLRRSDFLDKFGRYKEGVNVDIAEYNMSLSFLKNGGKGFIFNKIDGLFDQMNNADEPSTASYRKDWKNSTNLFTRLLRKIYLQYKMVKFHKDFNAYPSLKKD
ncbi:glycosyltransferase family 2 protein [Pedobacter metabolipauper]|uniref:Glycosyltransferase involved in cell wall biosynthesis n=1 Tax=Pedobacter metabolipauper TaxID=425513 RepID=A0A4R6T1P1_9SPHI|nr:glycosyltransferase [Pedobacter metabolipauper]TDQ11999.1 glycosyltransferase involved in cell wall biosynthesis [Pedobacter metabolipauper]